MQMNKKTYSPETEGFTMDRWASFYDLLINLISLGREAKLRDETVTLAGIQPGERVLDVGCGTGLLPGLTPRPG
jgi:demethylmenaquinone methyltransferase/2-methoxy-6-polyprenyl-1,4-benzoquinol methylase/phosphoethanolamine N-methyltransferase